MKKVADRELNLIQFGVWGSDVSAHGGLITPDLHNNKDNRFD